MDELEPVPVPGDAGIRSGQRRELFHQCLSAMGAASMACDILVSNQLEFGEQGGFVEITRRNIDIATEKLKALFPLLD